jgi:hypothetical protein
LPFSCREHAGINCQNSRDLAREAVGCNGGLGAAVAFGSRDHSVSRVILISIRLLVVSQICSNPRLQLLNECLIQIAIHIPNLKANDPFAEQFLAEFCAQSILVAFFHHKNDVGPANMAWGDTDTGAFLGSG